MRQPEKGDVVSAEVTNQPELMIYSDPGHSHLTCVGVHNLPRDLASSLNRHPEAGRLLRSLLRVRIVDAGAPGGEDLPDVLGQHQVLENGVGFIPRFPFDSGIRFRAIFDPQPLGRPELSQVLTLEFSLPRVISAVPTEVKHVFPSSDSLPENLLRFYVCFSNPMQRGRSTEQITLLGPDGRPAPDALYRAPIELWDRSMRHLTILLDPGRIKRGVGSNRALGPPLKVGQEYTLAIGSGMMDFCGRSLGNNVYKTFQVTQAVREPIAVQQWKIVAPVAKTYQPLVLMFPKPLDWALLLNTITIALDGSRPIEGRITIDQSERLWRFTPASPWAAGSYSVRIAPGLEDVCGNSLLEAFDRPLRSAADLVGEPANRSIPFQVA
jgi:hypothetical protein